MVFITCGVFEIIKNNISRLFLPILVSIVVIIDIGIISELEWHFGRSVERLYVLFKN